MQFLPQIKSRFLVSAVIFGVLLLAIVLLIAWPALSEIRLINRQVYDERVRLEKLYLKGQLQKKVRESYNRIKGATEFLDKIVLKENDELTYITAVEQAAGAAGVNLKINVGERKRSPGQALSTLNFNFELQGPWPAVAGWLEKMELLPFYSNVQESTFAVRADKDNGSRTVHAGVGVSTFWLVEK